MGSVGACAAHRDHAHLSADGARVSGASNSVSALARACRAAASAAAGGS